jgi:hypothetical protein
MERCIFSVVLAWLFPGAGHVLEKRFKTGLVIAVVFLAMFTLGAVNGGLNYPGTGVSRDSFLLHLLNIFARLGNGLGYLVFLAFGELHPEAAAKTTFEYGGRLIEIAGLVNYLAVLNCLDISLGRRK